MYEAYACIQSFLLNFKVTHVFTAMVNEKRGAQALPGQSLKFLTSHQVIKFGTKQERPLWVIFKVNCQKRFVQLFTLASPAET